MRVSDGTNAVDAALVLRLSDVVDEVAPSLSSASVGGGVLTLAFDEALDEESVPPASSFAVTAGASARTVDAVEVSGETVVVTFSPSARAGETVTVGYTVPTGPDKAPLRDAAGNGVASFASAEAENRTTLTVVSIRAASTPVTEGTAAAFVLTRTGATAPTLTVAVSVTEAGSVVNSATPSSATFAAGASEVRLSVATVNDGVHEADARLSATIQGADGYEVEEGARSAVVDVFDDDAAAPPATEVWSSTLAWTDLGNHWFGGFAEAFSDPQWSEGGQDFRIWYIAYDAGSRELSMAHRGVDGVIGEPGQLALHVGGLTLGAGDALSAFARAAVARVGGTDSQWRAGEQVRVRLTRTVGEAGPVDAGPALSVADAEVNESAGVPLRFRVTLDAPAQSAVSVRYRTADGSARAGADYAPAHGAVRFARGETAKTVEVAVVKDSHDEGSETMTLTLYRPSGASIGDDVATGTIVNTGAMPGAWMVRFGRTVGSQVVDALTQRLEGASASHVTVAGINVIGAPGLEPQAEDDDPFGLPEWAKDAEREAEAQTITADDIVLRSAFHLSSGTRGTGGDPAFTTWGRVATAGFDAEVDDVKLDGDVTTGMIGFDAEWERLLAGVMLSQSTGDGSYRLDPAKGTDGGTVESDLTGVYPYARVDLNERVSAWGLAGAGSGTITLKRDAGKAMKTDLSMRMGALGVKGQVLDGSGPSRIGLNVKSDAMWVGTKSARSADMVATEGDVTRLRLIVQGERVFVAGNGATFTPSAEVGLRHDGGDAETGSGVEVGGGLRYIAGPLTIEGQVRMLVAHEESGYEEWGASGAIRVTPSPSGRGLTLSIAPAWGRTGSATERLWSAHDARGLGADNEFEAAGQLAMDAGYGVGLPGNRGVLTPYAGVTLGDAGTRTMRTGTRWQFNPDTVVSVEATRQASDASAPANELMLRAALRF